ncbi:hypothetical protein FHS85_003549 [Rhodoligotrophos appendicifer]|uniref:hypothetical protein n=1 Tax=Rhodoligotrophos appendicifer TaxID=987056 RepID=UPI00118632ED|nr:hypothetical protein [Rhodoligotrophos appendicifer]
MPAFISKKDICFSALEPFDPRAQDLADAKASYAALKPQRAQIPEDAGRAMERVGADAKVSKQGVTERLDHDRSTAAKPLEGASDYQVQAFFSAGSDTVLLVLRGNPADESQTVGVAPAPPVIEADGTVADRGEATLEASASGADSGLQVSANRIADDAVAFFF